MLGIIDRSKEIIICAAVGTAGSLFISYGLREFLRATGGGYYCCSHYVHQSQGIILSFIGWLMLFVAMVSLYHSLTGQ